MKTQNSADYYLGLDMGTDSVGWAVTDLAYNLEKLNGKHLWGVRLFDAGESAVKRRAFRTSRRRLDRRKQRIQLLQELFAGEICKVDPGFFLRLEDSKFLMEDKAEKQPYSLFNDENYTDRDYHKQYPTIYHLRKALIDDSFADDPRLLYLAFAHIMKNRGHFLYAGTNMGSLPSFREVFDTFNLCLYDAFDFTFECSDFDSLQACIKSRSMGITEKKKRLRSLLSEETKQQQAFADLLAGASVNIRTLLDTEELEDIDKKSLSFSDADIDEELEQLSAFTPDKTSCIGAAKAIHDWGLLADIMHGEKYLSFARVKIYEKHKEDLALLKKIVKKYIPEEYAEIFRGCSIKNNYCAYVGMNEKKGIKQVVTSGKCTQRDLCKYLDGKLKMIKAEDPDLSKLCAEISSGTLLPKQASKDNCVIPYQINSMELKVILNNAKKRFAFLNGTDNSEISVSDKIEMLFTFRIPYYVGPLNDAHKSVKNSHCWIVKKSDEKIRAWNFDKVIDKEATATGFIRKMTNKCTYIAGADVLPKDSLLYSKYMVLNELNNLKINGEDISAGLKQDIYNDLFMKYPKVNANRLYSYLLSKGVVTKTGNDKISGIDGDFKASLKPYLDFADILKLPGMTDDMVEEIISAIVLFPDDRAMLTERINRLTSGILSQEQLRRITNFRYSGWAQFSRELLTEIYDTDKTTGEAVNIISALEYTNNNIMQLLSGRYGYLDQIKKRNAELNGNDTTFSYENLVENLYASPAVKRSIWQALVIVKEIKKLMGGNPQKVFIEVAREDGEKNKRTVSRKERLLDLYKNCRCESDKWLSEINSKSDGDLRSDKLFLYYTQMGKCMYTGEDISLDDLFNDNLYDIDHIYPKSKVKDDSIENRVLVKKQSNLNKSDVYPLLIDVQNKNRVFWKLLYEKEFIGKIKYERLTRTTCFSEDELAGFINRQLVETRQSTKATAEALQRVLERTNVVYSKAGNVSDFRQEFNLLKVRDVNDLHHAKDAYLNVVVGNVYDTKFTSNPLNFIKDRNAQVYNMRRMFDFDVKRSGYTAWKAGSGGTIDTVKTVMHRSDILFTRYSYEGGGGFFDQMLMKKGKGQYPIKTGDPRYAGEDGIKKYGGYNKISGSYYFLVEHDKKKKKVRSIEFIPVYLTKDIENDSTLLLSYCINDLELINPRILLPKIKINTLFKTDGFLMHLSSRSESRLVFKGANQLILNEKNEAVIKKISKFVERQRISRDKLYVSAYDGITKENNLEIYDVLSSKLESSVYSVFLSPQAIILKNKRDVFINLTIEDQCKVMLEILNLFQCNSTLANLTLISEGKETGMLRIQKTISNKKSVKIINQSPTGVFSQEIDLNKL